MFCLIKRIVCGFKGRELYGWHRVIKIQSSFMWWQHNVREEILLRGFGIGMVMGYG